MTTAKYGFPDFSTGAQNWNALLQTLVGQLESYIWSYLRYQVDATYTIVKGQPLCIVNGKWRPAINDGVNIPPIAIAIEAGIAGAYVVGQRSGVLTVTSWNWNVSAASEVYLAGGSISQSPSSWKIGVVVNATSILIDIDRNPTGTDSLSSSSSCSSSSSLSSSSFSSSSSSS